MNDADPVLVPQEVFIIQTLAVITLLEKAGLMTREVSGRIFRARIDAIPSGETKESCKAFFAEVLKYCGADYSQDKPTKTLKLVD